MRLFAFGVVAASASLTGCNAILGIEEFPYSPEDGGLDVTVSAQTEAGSQLESGIGPDSTVADAGVDAPAPGNDAADAALPLDPHRVVQISLSAGLGGTACALTLDGLVYCWGGNFAGEVGDGTRIDRMQAVQVQVDSTGAPFANIVEVSVGAAHVCARDKYRYFYCWGDGEFGQLGDGRYNSDGGTYEGGLGAVVSTAPAKLRFRGTGPVQIVAGNSHSCVVDDPHIDAGFSLECWGSNFYGELGHDAGTNGDVIANVGYPVTVNPQPGLVVGAAGDLSGVSLGAFMGCYLRPDETVWCWGGESAGTLGSPNVYNTSTPFQVPRPNDAGVLGAILEVSAREATHVCARDSTSSGNVWCWGSSNEYGELGTGAAIGTASQAVKMAVGDVRQIAVSIGNTCALVGAQGEVLCWGSNSNNQLGHPNLGDPLCSGIPCDGPTFVGTLDDAGTPFSGAVQISMGWNFACALKADGSVWCWGAGAKGRLGNGATNDSAIPVQVLGLP